MNKFISVIFSPILTRTNLAILVLVSFLGAAMGPFGSFEAHTFLNRLIYWSSVSLASIVIGSACYRASRHFISKNRPLVTDLVMTGLMVLFFTPPLWFLTLYLVLQDPLHGPSLPKMAYYVASIAMSVCVLRRIIPGLEPVGYFGAVQVDEPENPRLVRRLPPEFNGKILRLSVRDHFVDVVSDIGTDTIRMRFADAIDEMDTVIGHCTHRSHWVAQDAIVGAERSNGRIYLRLTNGDQVPVSRKYKPDLEAAGLLQF